MIDEWLKTLGIDTICQWDVVIFLHRHRTTLLDAENLARLMRYKAAPIVVALESLETLGLVERSRLSQGARLYQLTRLEGPRGGALAELLTLSETRTGRLKVAERLNNIQSRKAFVLGVVASRDRSRKTDRRSERGPQISKEGNRWPKAI